MGGLKTIISDCAGSGQSDVDDGGPALKLVVAVMMKEVRGANGDASAGRFDCGERGVMVYGVVGEKNFLAAAAAHVECGEVIQRARSCDPGEEQVVFLVPEFVFGGKDGGFRGKFRRRLRPWSYDRGRRFLSVQRGCAAWENQKRRDKN